MLTLLKIIRPLLEGWPFKFVHILRFHGIRHSVETVSLTTSNIQWEFSKFVNFIIIIPNMLTHDAEIVLFVSQEMHLKLPKIENDGLTTGPVLQRELSFFLPGGGSKIFQGAKRGAKIFQGSKRGGNFFSKRGGTKFFLLTQRGGPEFFLALGGQKKLTTRDHRQTAPPLTGKK